MTMNDGLVTEMGILDKENVLLLARIAEQSEQYDDMIDILKPYFELKAVDEDLSSEERNLLQVAYKNAVGLRRIAWRAAKKSYQHQQVCAIPRTCRGVLDSLGERVRRYLQGLA